MDDESKRKALELACWERIRPRLDPADQNITREDLDAVVAETNRAIHEMLVKRMRNRPTELEEIRTIFKSLLAPDAYEQWEQYVFSILVEPHREAAQNSNDVEPGGMVPPQA